MAKQTHLPAPRLQVPGATICIGLGTSFPEARASAVRQAYELLKADHGMSEATAYAYTCARVGIMPAGPSGSMMSDGLEAVLALIPDP